MSNILKVTSPVSGFDQTANVRIDSQNRVPGQQVQGPVIPEQVVRPDGRTDAGSDKQDSELKFKYESNFDNFVREILKSGDLTKDTSKVFMERMKTIVNSGIRTDFAKEVGEFMDMTKMTEKELFSFLKTQADSNVKLTGAFFQTLRQLFDGSESVQVRSEILDFLKRYIDMVEGNHLLNQIEHLLDKIKKNMFSNAKEEVENIEKEINFLAKNGDVKNNAAVIKEKLLPFLNEYVKTMHDRGTLRESAAEIAKAVARYENGDIQRLQEAFEELLKMPAFSQLALANESAKGKGSSLLLGILSNTDFERASQNNNVLDKLAEIIKRGVNGEGGVENRIAFKQIMNGLVLNESVYMPLMHFVLPLNIDGTMMYSEMWIDPDAEGNGAGGNKKNNKAVRGLVKFDIENVGFFDVFFIYAEGEKENLSMQIHYPEKLRKKESEIRRDIKKILEDNNFNPADLVFSAGENSIPITEAFPEVFERRNSVNVRI